MTKDPEVNAPEELPPPQMPPAKAQVTFPDRDGEKTSLEEQEAAAAQTVIEDISGPAGEAKESLISPPSASPPAPSFASTGRRQPGEVMQNLYEVKKVLGEGAFGIIYLVRHRGWHLDLAVKQPKPEALAGKGGLDKGKFSELALCDLSAARVIRSFEIAEQYHCPVCISQDEQYIFAVTPDWRLVTWEMATGRQIRSLDTEVANIKDFSHIARNFLCGEGEAAFTVSQTPVMALITAWRWSTGEKLSSCKIPSTQNLGDREFVCILKFAAERLGYKKRNLDAI